MASHLTVTDGKTKTTYSGFSDNPHNVASATLVMLVRVEDTISTFALDDFGATAEVHRYLSDMGTSFEVIGAFKRQ